MKCQTPETWCAEGIFQIQTLFMVLMFQNNMLIPHVRDRERKTKPDLTFQLLTSSINPSIILYTGSGLFSRVYHVQITGMCICETFFPPITWSDH